MTAERWDSLLLLLHMPVVVCQKSCNLLCNWEPNTACFTVWIPVLKCFGFRAELRRMNRFFFALWRGTFFFFPFSLSLPLSLSWRQTYVRGESLPTAPLCFCFSQWANVSLPRPHSLSSRPLSWKHSLAEATQGQACEVGGWGGGALPANHMIWPYSHSSTWGSDAARTFQQPVCHQHDWMRL